MSKCDVCGVERSSPCVGVGANRRILGGAKLWRAKTPSVIAACPYLKAMIDNPNSTSTLLVYTEQVLSMEFDLCQQAVESHRISVAQLREHVPHITDLIRVREQAQQNVPHPAPPSDRWHASRA